MPIIIVFLLLLTGGCTLTTDRYSPSADNVAAIRSINGQAVNIGHFSYAAGVAETELQCKGVKIAPPDQILFADYIRNSLIAELKMAGVYSPNAHITITGKIDVLDIDTSSFSTNGKWRIELTLSGNGRSFKASENYNFQALELNRTRCEVAARQLTPAVQNLLSKVISAPEFSMMVKP